MGFAFIRTGALMALLGPLLAEAPVQLDIPAREQWTNNRGYCGETSIQRAALFFGTYVSQREARKIIDPAQQQDALVPDGTDTILTALRLEYEDWDFWGMPNPQYQAFLVWTKGHLAAGHPVIITAFDRAGSDPDYDHIMLATGFQSPDSTIFHGTDALTFADNFQNAQLARTFQTLWDTRRMAGNGITNEFCIPKSTDYGTAITGVRDDSGALRPVSISLDRWNEPNVTRGAAPVSLNAVITIKGLIPGATYALLRYNDPGKIPTGNYLKSAFSSKVVFTADAGSKVLADQIPSDSLAAFRCVPASSDFSARIYVATSGMDISFPGDAGMRYSVEWSPDLSPASWSVLRGNIPGTGVEVRVNDPDGRLAPRRFYRVIRQGSQ